MPRKWKAWILVWALFASVAHFMWYGFAIQDRLHREMRPVVRAQGDLHALSFAASSFHFEQHRWPVSIEELCSPDLPGGPYIHSGRSDPWSGGPYLLRIGADGTPEFVSLGSDRAPGGVGPAADIIVRARDPSADRTERP